MVQLLSIIFFLGFIQFLLGFSKVPVFLCHSVFPRQYHSTNDVYSSFIYQSSPLYSCRCRCLTLEATLNTCTGVKWPLHHALQYEQFIVSLHNALLSVSRILDRYSCFILWGKRYSNSITGPEGSRRLRLPDFKSVGSWS